MRSKLLFTIVFACMQCATFAQNLKKPSTHEIAQLPDWAKLMYSENPSIFEVDALYRSYFQEHDFIKTFHTQYYKRWRRAAQPYLNAAGYIQKPNEGEQGQIDQAYLRKQKQQKSSNWSAVGPITNFQEGLTQGSGQTNVYSFDQCLNMPNVCYCGTEPGEVYKSIDAGANWTCVSLALDFGSGVTAVEVDYSNPNTVFAGGNKGIFRSNDGGNTWINVLPNSNFGVTF